MPKSLFNENPEKRRASTESDSTIIIENFLTVVVLFPAFQSLASFSFLAPHDVAFTTTTTTIFMVVVLQ